MLSGVKLVPRDKILSTPKRGGGGGSDSDSSDGKRRAKRSKRGRDRKDKDKRRSRRRRSKYSSEEESRSDTNDSIGEEEEEEVRRSKRRGKHRRRRHNFSDDDSESSESDRGRGKVWLIWSGIVIPFDIYTTLMSDHGVLLLVAGRGKGKQRDDDEDDEEDDTGGEGLRASEVVRREMGLEWMLKSASSSIRKPDNDEKEEAAHDEVMTMDLLTCYMRWVLLLIVDKPL